MRLVAAKLQPFDLGEFTEAPSMLSALCRWSGLILLSFPSSGTTRSLRQFQPLRDGTGGRDNILVLLDRAPFAFAMERLRKLGKP
jgi:hypothetical protein